MNKHLIRSEKSCPGCRTLLHHRNEMLMSKKKSETLQISSCGHIEICMRRTCHFPAKFECAKLLEINFGKMSVYIWGLASYILHLYQFIFLLSNAFIITGRRT